MTEDQQPCNSKGFAFVVVRLLVGYLCTATAIMKGEALHFRPVGVQRFPSNSLATTRAKPLLS